MPSLPREQPVIRSATIHEIARMANVSTASVSRSLNGERGVSKQTMARVCEIAIRLGYYPSSSARTLVTGRSRTFGLLVSDIVNPFFSELLREFEEEAVRQRYEVIVVNINNDPQRIQQSARRLFERRVDGVAIMTAEQPTLTSELRRRRIPMVFLEGASASRHRSNIEIDSRTGIQQAMQHLKALGHVNVGYIGAHLSLAPSLARMSAFTEAVRHCGTELSTQLMSTENQPTLEGGNTGFSRLMGSPSRPTAVLVFNDAMAFGVMHAARRLGMIVPRDLSVVGFDDVEIAAYSEPELTTIHTSRAELASFAFNTLFKMCNQTSTGETIALPSSLVVRSTTGRCP